jgi:hypothetical protein
METHTDVPGLRGGSGGALPAEVVEEQRGLRRGRISTWPAGTRASADARRRGASVGKPIGTPDTGCAYAPLI